MKWVLKLKCVLILPSSKERVLLALLMRKKFKIENNSENPSPSEKDLG
jgi:hypothetical protein